MKYEKGNKPANFKDHTGEKFGFLTVIRKHHQSVNGKARWVCVCECGKEKVVTGDSLRFGQVSCGCKRKTRETHGMSSTKTFRVWTGMLSRCRNKRCPAYPNYGGRGVTVCDRWLVFENFYQDMGACAPGMSLERIDVNGNYEPSNCTWIPLADQGKNKRTTKSVLGMSAPEAAEKLGLSYSTLMYRLSNGVPVDKPVGRQILITHNGESLSIKEWSERLGIARSTISVRRKKGLPPEMILKVNDDIS